MRILHWSESFWPFIGGVEVSSRQLPPLLRRRGWEMIVVTGHHHLDLPDEDALEDIRIFRFPFAAAFTQHDLGRIVRIRRQVAELKHDFKPDIVHLNLVGPSALMDARTTGPVRTPTLMSVHTQPSDGALASGTLYRSVLSSADWIIACSDAVLQEARSQAPEIVPRSSVAYLGLAMPDLVPARLPDEVPRILCVGRLVPRKGSDLAIRAFARLAGRFTTARLVIAGGGTLRPELEALGRELKVDDRIQFLGWVDPDDIPSLINSATLVLIPSWSEGLPLVAIQAGQMARPSVVTRVSGLPEVVLDGETGIVVEPRDEAALAAAIATLLERPELARRMGEAARRRVGDLFGLERCADVHATLFLNLVQERNGVASR